MFAMLMPAAAFLFVNSLYLMLRVSPAAGSFPRPLTAAEEREALEKWAQGNPVSYTHLDVYKRQSLQMSQR